MPVKFKITETTIRTPNEMRTPDQIGDPDLMSKAWVVSITNNQKDNWNNIKDALMDFGAWKYKRKKRDDPNSIGGFIFLAPVTKSKIKKVLSSID